MARTGEDDKTDQRPDRVRPRDDRAGQTASYERPMPLYEPLFRIPKPWRGRAGSSRPPIRPTDRIRRITRGHYAQEVPSAPTG